MDPVISSIMLWPCNWAPSGWHFCDGQSLPISQYNVLHSLIGTTYGGDGVNNFNLPNMQSISASGAEVRYIICMMGIYPRRD